MVIAPEIKDAALSLLLVNRQRGILESVAVKTPSHGEQRLGILEDIAASTGGRCFRREVGESIVTATVDDLGSARQAWARPRSFGILGGHGSREAIRARIVATRAELATVKDNDWLKKRLQERIGKLSGSAVMIVVGAPSEAARDELKLRIESAVTMARAAVRDGVVPGGGAAFLACAAVLERKVAGRRDDEAVGWRMLAAALAEPMRAIAANAGLEAERDCRPGGEARPGPDLRRLEGGVGRSVGGRNTRLGDGADDRARRRRERGGLGADQRGADPPPGQPAVVQRLTPGGRAPCGSLGGSVGGAPSCSARRCCSWSWRSPTRSASRSWRWPCCPPPSRRSPSIRWSA